MGNYTDPGNGDKLKIALIAPPWLSTGPSCYFGIENMVHYLATGLKKQGHHVELFTVGGSTTKVNHRHWYHKEEQYKHIHRPYYYTASIIISHVLYALNQITKAGDFDIIHDHNDFIGPAVLAYANHDLPPVLHTLHEPFTNLKLIHKGIPDNRLMYEQFKALKHIYFNCVSKRQIKEAPRQLKSHLLGHVYNGIDPDDYKFNDQKKDFFLSIGSIKRDKGQARAAKICHDLDEKLKIAGIISGGIRTPAQLEDVLQKPNSEYRNNSDFKYFMNEVKLELQPGQIDYIGVVMGEKKLRLLSQAKALLSPIEWEEPFGIVIIEALASGTPVVTYARGAMPEIIKHGVNGFLAHNEREFRQYVKRVGDIDPEACRKSVVKNFSSQKMAEEYTKLYEKVIALSQSNSKESWLSSTWRQLSMPD